MATSPGKLEQVAKQLKELSETIAAEEASGIATQRANRIRWTVAEAYNKLRQAVFPHVVWPKTGSA